MPTRDQSALTGNHAEGPPVQQSPTLLQALLGAMGLGRSNVPPANVRASAESASHEPNRYVGLNNRFYKDRVSPLTNQSQRAAVSSRQTMMFDPRNSPSRSQKQEGYTAPIQVFASSNTWQTQAGLTSRGKRQSQPSIRQVSPFASLPIPTRMPWDL